MPNANKTLNIEYRFLSPKDFQELYKTSLAAFADYIVPLQMTKEQFENHIAQNAVDLELSVGAFSGSKLVGYTLNGFGMWNGEKTVYDAGTGVIPKFRKKGIGKAMFGFLLPELKKIGVKQMLLEVISGNEKAVNLYKKLGFRKTRNLLFFEQTKKLTSEFHNKIQIRQIENPNWKLLKTFWDEKPSWQFSTESIDRKISPKIILGAFLNDRCIGYCIFYKSSGIISQIAVEKDYRRQKVGSMFLANVQNLNQNGKPIRFCNIDDNLDSLIGFAKKMEFNESISQIEMILTL